MILKADTGKKPALKRLKAMFEFELLLHETGRAMDAAWEMKKLETETGKGYSKDEFTKALKELESAPLKAMFDVYVQRVNSRGELGVLSSLNQRVWAEYNELKKYLNARLKE